MRMHLPHPELFLLIYLHIKLHTEIIRHQVSCVLMQYCVYVLASLFTWCNILNILINCLLSCETLALMNIRILGECTKMIVHRKKVMNA